MKKGRIILTITILILINFISAQSNPKAVVEYSCSASQGFYFDRYNADNVGHVTYMKLCGDPEMDADLTVTDPISTTLPTDVVGVMRNIYWEGGYAQPIEITFLISASNKTYMSALVHQSLPNTDVEFDFNVYQYDPIAKTYFKAFYPVNNAILLGLIQIDGAYLQLFVNDTPDGVINPPLVFEMTIGIMPQDLPQALLVAVSSTQSFTKQWGFGNPAVPELILPSDGSSTTDLTPTFDWNDVYTATSYTILVDNNSDFSSPEINQTPSTSTYTPGSNLAGGTYFWKVRSTNSNGSSNYTSSWSLSLIDPPVPPLPYEFRIEQRMDGHYYLIWDVVADATGYNIYSSVDPYDIYITSTLEATVETNEYDITDIIINNQRCFFYVTAVN